MRASVDLSCDLGEATTPEQEQREDAIWPLISSANVACGGHVGDERSIARAVERATRYHVQLGAHPSYPDRANFGRRSMRLDPSELRDSLVEQLAVLSEAAGAAGAALSHVKPHGALYNDAHHDEALAETIVQAIVAVSEKLEIVCAAGSALERAARAADAPVVLEAFGDRRYRPDGSLTPRSSSESLLLSFDDAVQQVQRLVRANEVIADDGTSVPIGFSTLCLHGDMPRASQRIDAVRHALRAAGVTITSAARVTG